MEEAYEEPRRPSLIDKAGRQMRKHPLIPTGMIATVGALTMALKRMQQRDAVGYQRWLRARVLAQGLTIVAIVVAGVQEMGVGVLTGNANSIAHPPATEWESREFEKRLKEAEDTHHAETGFGPSSSRNTQNDTPPSSIVQAVHSAAPPPQSSSSTWMSWLWMGKK
ncbi:uncharacterized protein FOMMEDRAFT_131868 [Fomitiporia mediterranea MF3/22]|uniref:uncharacterized protein n=1 Tax=Fomitiporia mediterranea (strain MF3/22) TaxID=694068 RepID=UPI00044090B9|nr:uncharacterized protein FOMMEDRAFT_131868 [Fomitiporia mediterranea MF3/22]EJD05300.1 hypothetical protein FOMMEDRAFT_131868 [Fomitiporia mediterranea MF3/22]